ncbi:MAG TPA: hypothetical protein VMM12_14735 [Longimicrobiales bacterium]|nr:hypothetical protein [Longimicrobiales bacterium]
MAGKKKRKDAAPLEVREAAAGYAFARRARAAEPTRRKNLRLTQSKIDEAREALGTKTETETIEAALDLVVFRKELVEGIRAMRGAALEDVFGTGG